MLGINNFSIYEYLASYAAIMPRYTAQELKGLACYS